MERFVAWTRRRAEALATRSERFEHGVAHFVPELPDVYWLNRILLDLGTRAGAEELALAADRLQGGAGLFHRRLVTDDDEGGRLGSELRRLGWEAAEHVVLVHRGDAPGSDPGQTQEVPFAEVAPLLEREAREEGHDAETARQLVAARKRLVACVPTRFFVARADGEPAAHCELYAEDGLAQIENVGTLERFRGGGLGTRVVLAALAAAGGARTYILADADDWPAGWYERLGFERIGRRFELTRTLAALHALRVRTPRLELRLPDRAELYALAELARRGVHPPERMPFYVPWTDRADEPTFLDDVVAHHLERQAAWSHRAWTLGLAALHDGEPVGMQAVRGDAFVRERVVDTGSWLGAGFQDRGLGTEMRAGVLELAFRGLGARAATSGAMADNPQSRRVSEKLGYRHVGDAEQRPRGEPVVEHLYRLEAGRWRTPVEVELERVEPALPLFGL